MKNILLKIAYDGTNFSGWQRQPEKRTVCGELEKTLSAILKEEIKLDGTSRTDAGVHAFGQCASFKSNLKIPVENLAKVLNNALASDRLEGLSDIRIISAEEKDETFHARFSSKGKRYIYRIKNTEAADIFIRNYCYQVYEKLDVDLMKRASEYIVGEHDFACFQTAGSPKESTVRTIYSIDIEKSGDDIYISIAGNGFLYNMVRIIVGTLAEVGLGKKKPEDLINIINSCDRKNAGHTAPPQGLYLDEVFY